ncbi:hypothetical protein HHI36_017253 [Cryptolaemus montrouzieri]|uniref:L-Fucosyltransferase n=1 Tax=Cryptolaemus montrouzieri TaxID=559131 RepID=A0ABD2NM97_9CUCU
MFNSHHNILFKAIILALCVISSVHIFLFPLYGLETQPYAVKTLQGLEQSLCTISMRHHKTGKKAKCPNYGIVTVMQGGRIGNQIWEYASVWALARRTGLEPYIPRCIKLKLEQVFSSLSVPTFEEIAHCPFEMDKFVKSLDEWNYTNQSIILPRYIVQPELVLTWVQDIKQELTIKKKLLKKAQYILRMAAKNRTNCTFVGVHIRRTDYINRVMTKYSAKPADLSFYTAAMKYFEKKYLRVIFIIVSDDPKWCIKQFAGNTKAYITGTTKPNTPALDLAVLSSCNHSIFDYGTYGQWGAILAGGETVFYSIKDHSSYRVGQLLPNWHALP